MSEPTTRQRVTAPPWATLAAGALGGLTCGLWVARLTLGLNSSFDGASIDRGMLCVWLGVLYGLGGLFWGVVVLAVGRVVSRWRRDPTGTDAPQFATAWGLPVLAGLALPDSGLHRTAMTTALSQTPLVQILLLLLTCLVLSGLGLALGSSRPARRGWLLAILLPAFLLLWTVLASSRPEEVAPKTADLVELDAGRPPLILLCIDGADPDDLLLPGIEDGSLPTFARLLQEGTFGELATLAPTLSPAVWTSLATGKLPEEHGILHFVLFDLPGISRPVAVFPLHSGLNFKVFPLIERLPGAPALQAPYTSERRRVPALWNILSDYAPVGMFRWRVTWPVEEVDGFAVASDVSLLDQMPGYAATGPATDQRRVYPEGLYKGTRRDRRQPGTLEEVRRYLSPEAAERTTDLDDPALRPLVNGVDRALSVRFTELVGKYRPLLAVAGYHSVDGFSHLYWRDRLNGGRFERAIDERYRFVDEELGKTLAALEEQLGEFNLVIVSDHGFDLRQGHHTHAPPGIFFGWGPAFDAGRRVDDLHVLDITPLALDLVGLPVALDMPGAGDGREEPSFRRALSAEQRQRHELRWTDSYGDRFATEGVTETPFEEETLKKLRSLGYIN